MFIACGSAWRADPRLVQAQVHPPARAARPRGWRSDSRLRRGSFALRMGRSPMRKPHVPCVWSRLARQQLRQGRGWEYKASGVGPIRRALGVRDGRWTWQGTTSWAVQLLDRGTLRSRRQLERSRLAWWPSKSQLLRLSNVSSTRRCTSGRRRCSTVRLADPLQPLQRGEADGGGLLHPLPAHSRPLQSAAQACTCRESGRHPPVGPQGHRQASVPARSR